MSTEENSTGEPSAVFHLHARQRKRERVKEPQKHSVPSLRSPSERPEVSPPCHHQTNGAVNKTEITSEWALPLLFRCVAVGGARNSRATSFLQDNETTKSVSELTGDRGERSKHPNSHSASSHYLDLSRDELVKPISSTNSSSLHFCANGRFPFIYLFCNFRNSSNKISYLPEILQCVATTTVLRPTTNEAVLDIWLDGAPGRKYRVISAATSRTRKCCDARP